MVSNTLLAAAERAAACSMAGAGLQLTRIDCGVIKQGVIPKDEAEHERRLPRKVNVARKHEIVGNFAVVEARIVIEGDALH